MHFLKEKSSAGLKIPSLDGLRGIAILFVLLSHLSNEGFGIINWSGKGKYGVYLFFVLSAFLLSYPFFNGISIAQKEISKFFKRRLLRIFPLFLVITLFDFYLCDKEFSYNQNIYINYSFGDILTHLLLIDLKGIFWAIDVEFKFYLMLPLLIYIFSGFVLIYMLLYRHMVINYEAGYWALILKYLPMFLAGIYIADIYSKYRDNNNVKYALLCEVVGLFLFVFTLFIPGGQYHESILFFSVLWALVILCQLLGTGFLSRLLSIKPLRFIGAISFSIYLLHYYLIELAKNMGIQNMGLGFIIIVSITFILSSISYIVIERPFIILAKR